MMIENSFTYPVLDASALGDQPVAVSVLGEDWVLWRDGQGRPRAAPDRCPHRGARLSLGTRCADGDLQCPYHGWRFAGDGRCTGVPALTGFVPPAGYALPALGLLETRGLLWLRPDGEAPCAPPSPDEDDATLRALTMGPYDVETSAPRIVENFLDIAHFSFVHAGWLGEAAQPEVPAYQVDASTGDGVRATGVRAWQPQATHAAEGGAWVDYDYHAPTPYAALLRKRPESAGGQRQCYALHILPLQPERSRVWFRILVADHASSDEQLRAFQDTIFRQDQPVLESQRPRRLPVSDAAPVREVHCAADRLSAAYRRHLRQLGITFGVC